MSVEAMRIVQEEIQKQKDSIPNIHESHALLRNLEQRIVERVERELLDIPDCPTKTKMWNFDQDVDL